jgi:hypothetical protein
MVAVLQKSDALARFFRARTVEISPPKINERKIGMCHDAGITSWPLGILGSIATNARPDTSNVAPISTAATLSLFGYSSRFPNIILAISSIAGGTAGKMYPGSFDFDAEKNSTGHRNQHRANHSNACCAKPRLNLGDGSLTTARAPVIQGKSAIQMIGT